MGLAFTTTSSAHSMSVSTFMCECTWMHSILSTERYVAVCCVRTVLIFNDTRGLLLEIQSACSVDYITLLHV